MPSGKIDLPIIEDNRDGTVRIQYDPTEDGVHELVLLYNSVPVEGKKLKIEYPEHFLGLFFYRSNKSLNLFNHTILNI